MADLQPIQDILALYEEASGQKLNHEKTTICFSKAVKEDTKALISDFFTSTRGERVWKLPWLAGDGGKEEESKSQLH